MREFTPVGVVLLEEPMVLGFLTLFAQGLSYTTVGLAAKFTLIARDDYRFVCVWERERVCECVCVCVCVCACTGAALFVKTCAQILKILAALNN